MRRKWLCQGYVSGIVYKVFGVSRFVPCLLHEIVINDKFWGFKGLLVLGHIALVTSKVNRLGNSFGFVVAMLPEKSPAIPSLPSAGATGDLVYRNHTWRQELALGVRLLVSWLYAWTVSFFVRPGKELQRLTHRWTCCKFLTSSVFCYTVVRVQGNFYSTFESDGRVVVSHQFLLRSASLSNRCKIRMLFCKSLVLLSRHALWIWWLVGTRVDFSPIVSDVHSAFGFDYPHQVS